MTTFYFLKDKVCTLKKLSDDTYSEEFIITAPNGAGVYDVDIEEIESSQYVDPDGIIRTGFSEYRITLNFNYSSHKMFLGKLLLADYIKIPFAFSLNPIHEQEFDFILTNEELVSEYFAGLHNLQNEDEILGGLQLSFKSSNPLTRQQLLGITYEEDA